MGALRREQSVNGYVVISDPSNDRSGTAVWAFARKNGREYFIKQFLSPKKPNVEFCEDSENKRRERACREFEQHKSEILRRLRSGSKNHLQVPSLMSDDTSYYVIADRLAELEDPLAIFSACSKQDQYKILYNIASGVHALHQQKIVHGDIKPNNVVFEKLDKAGKVTLSPTIIDLDSAFLSKHPPTEEPGVVGDQLYMAPEIYLYNGHYVRDEKFAAESPAFVTTQSDIFSLGVLFFYYLRHGKQLQFADTESGVYPSQAVIMGRKPILESIRHHDGQVRTLLAAMLAKSPLERPEIGKVLDGLFLAAGQIFPWIPAKRFGKLLHVFRSDKVNSQLLQACYVAAPDDKGFRLKKEFAADERHRLVELVQAKHEIFFALLSHEKDLTVEMPEYDPHARAGSPSTKLKIKVRRPAVVIVKEPPRPSVTASDAPTTPSSKLKGRILAQMKKKST